VGAVQVELVQLGLQAYGWVAVFLILNGGVFPGE
jgi:hypothetical protein